jgi:hypothetical protein
MPARSHTMRSNLIRLAALAAGVVIVASCDSRLPSEQQFGSGSSSSSSNTTKKPTISIDSPVTGTLINLGDSVLVSVRLHDDRALKSATISGVTQTGSVDLGTFTQTQRYKQAAIPLTGTFRAGLKDTVVRRYLQPANKADSTLDSLVIVVIASDSAGAADTATRRINIVAGPRVNIISPTNNDSIPAGVGLSVAAHAQHVDGVGRIDIRVQGESNWPTKLDTTVTQVYTDAPRDITFSSVVRIPVNAPIRGRVTISASAVDVNRQPGSASPIAVFVRSASLAQPRVTQTVAAKNEFSDSVTVRATGDGIATLGLLIRDSVGTLVFSDTVRLSQPYNANVQQNVALGLPPALQGRRLGITAFAIDQAGRVGYAVPLSRSTPEANVANAVVDSTLIVYGRTFSLPHQGTIGDVVVDAARGNVFLSNTAFNLLEVWQSSVASKGFASTNIPVGSLPWGMFISNSPDTLLVANSGGTNISRVFIGSTSASSLHEDLPHRILTRNTYTYTVTVQRDEATGKIRLTANGPISYSDRPQYLVQSRGGRIFYSTRPTASAPAGSVRWLDPALTVPDPHQIWQYGTILNGTSQVYAIFNVDSLFINPAPPTSLASDKVTIYDHPYGSSADSAIVVTDSIPLNAIAAMVAASSDAEAVFGLDIGSLPLTDTTYAAESGNRIWMAFGEGHKVGAARVIVVADSGGPVPNFFSPLVTISDLTDNAAEQVFGLAVDKSGATVASHGTQSYFASVSNPFHLRLQGKYDSFDDGAGIAFHPSADGINSPQDQRLAFVAAASGEIEVVDIAYYINRARLPLKNGIYGPLRASLPMPGDPPEVILKLYALSQKGLVVIDLTATDIKPGP